MAGCGTLSAALQKEGIDVTPTDNFSWRHHWSTEENKLWTEVEEIDCLEAIKKYPDADIFIMSWTYMNNTAYESLKLIREVNPNALLIYIGEGWGGCTADDAFFDLVEKVDDEDFETAVQNFSQWYGLYDRIRLFR